MPPTSRAGLKERVAQLEDLSWSWEATTEALLVLGAALLVGIFGGGVHCYEYSRCHAAGTCANASWWRPLEMSCSFTNYVSVSGDRLYGYSNGTDLVSLTRGVCAAGERMHVNAGTHLPECAPWRSWPSALNTEIMKPGASSMHEQMCGAWIDGGPAVPLSVDYWSFYDGAKADAAVRRADAAMYSSARLGATDMGKFYAACEHTVLGGSAAIRAAAKAAYEHLKTGLTGLTTERRVLEAAGWLASHHCDGVLQLGVTVGGGGYKATAYRGTAFSTGVLAEALYVLDEPVSTQELAEAGRRLIAANAMNSPMATVAQLEHVFEGATLRTDHGSVPLLYAVTPELDGLVWLATQPRFAEARAFLHGAAAMCSFALQGGLDFAEAGAWTARAREVQRLRTERPKASALGRLSRGHDPRRLASDPSNETVAQASTVTFSQLRAAPVGTAASDCVGMANFLFPDRLDQEHFSLMITDRLYDRLETLTNDLREHVAQVVLTHPNVSIIFNSPSAVAAAVRGTRARIAGAPRGTWAGITRGYADGHLASGDGPLVMALKQSRAVFMDRINVLFDNLDACTGPPLYDALEQNAYVYPGGDCTHMMLGVMRKPFSDERYDNASLASRVGYIMAHEFAHNTLVTPWYGVPRDALLHRYSPNLYAEAIADIIAALAIVRSGLATALEACHHISQLWCARTPLLYITSSSASHPGPNERGDLLCASLRDLGLM